MDVTWGGKLSLREDSQAAEAEETRELQQPPLCRSSLPANSGRARRGVPDPLVEGFWVTENSHRSGELQRTAAKDLLIVEEKVLYMGEIWRLPALLSDPTRPR